MHQLIYSDFNKTKEQIKRELQIYIPDISNQQIEEWTLSNELENYNIDGETMYFHSAVRNILRTKPSLRQLLSEIEGRERAGRQYILSRHIPNVIDQTMSQIKSIKPMLAALPVTPIYGEYDPMGIYSNNPLPEYQNQEIARLSQTHEFNFYSRIIVEANAVPDGEEVRCWMPMPRTDILRQEFFDNDELIEEGNHACRYQTKIAKKSQPTVFTNKFTFTSAAEYHPIPENFEHMPTEPTDELLIFLGEQAPHIIFSDNLKQLAKDIIGDEKRPYFQARLLFEAMRTLYPWASAREYATIDNIPQYVVNQKHGDCGQISLLFITLCRIVGIPARWQSGFMLHPGYENLHDWSEIYITNLGWIPVDASFGVQHWGRNEAERYFYFGGIDAFRLVVNSDWGAPLSPTKVHPRSETVDFQRGEVEWKNENIYFNKFKFQFWVELL